MARENGFARPVLMVLALGDYRSPDVGKDVTLSSRLAGTLSVSDSSWKFQVVS